MQGEAELILQPLRHNSFSNPSVALPTSHLVLQPFRCFTYVTANFPILLSLLLRHRIFTYVTWRAAHELDSLKIVHYEYVEMFKKWKLRNTEWKTPLITYLNGT